MFQSSENTIPRAIARVWTEGRGIERVAYAVGMVLFVSGLVHAVVTLAMGASWAGPVSLRKPTTFGLSFGLTLITVGWVTSMLVIRATVRTLLLGVFTLACVVEVFLVSTQAWRGVPSHFNFETPLDNAIAMMLAAGGGLIVLTVLCFAGAALVGTSELPGSTRTAVWFGLVSLLLALASGAVMIAGGAATARGGDPQLAYDTAGWLKPLHAVTMHGILVLPGLAWLLRFSGRSDRWQLWFVLVNVTAYATLIAVVAIELFTGVTPFTAGPVETVVSVAALVVLLFSVAVALRGNSPVQRAQ